MPKSHARKKALANIKDLYGVKHTDAIALLESDDCEDLCDLLNTYADVNTYREAVAVLEARRNDPLNQVMCEDCGWVGGMACPECAKGCGCEYDCPGWRHEEARAATGDWDEDDDPYACECGAGGRDNPYGDCFCDEEDEEEDERVAVNA
ncbi:hypothetical protein [Streptomyces sp. Da 82-17]|uniref:hypothetical protein n=1 Tax=Streptomyces sp. Da 82-17 TaxID=3377116 RepID=UPI0038D367AF